jgi:hypothetical protein
MTGQDGPDDFKGFRRDWPAPRRDGGANRTRHGPLGSQLALRAVDVEGRGGRLVWRLLTHAGGVEGFSHGSGRGRGRLKSLKSTTNSNDTESQRRGAVGSNGAAPVRNWAHMGSGPMRSLGRRPVSPPDVPLGANHPPRASMHPGQKSRQGLPEAGLAVQPRRGSPASTTSRTNPEAIASPHRSQRTMMVVIGHPPSAPGWRP